MTITFDTTAIYKGEDSVQDLGDDVSKAFQYLDQHIDGSQAWVKGVLMEALLQDHAEFVTSVNRGLEATRECMRSTSAALGDVGRDYDASEADAQAKIRELFGALDSSGVSDPITSSTPRRSVGVSEPSSALATPISPMSDPAFVVVWDVLNWPSYISLSYWIRTVLGKIVNFVSSDVFQGRDPLEHAAHLLSGDWDEVAKAGCAFGHLGDYYKALSDALNDVGVDLATGWPEGAGADASAELFAELVAVMDSQTRVYADLDKKYTDAAWAAFSACQVVLSAVDALIDTVLAAAITGKSIGEILLTPFTGGATLPVGIVSAIIALTQAFAAAWNLLMTAAATFIGVGAALGSATREIEFIQLPEV